MFVEDLYTRRKQRLSHCGQGIKTDTYPKSRLFQRNLLLENMLLEPSLNRITGYLLGNLSDDTALASAVDSS